MLSFVAGVVNISGVFAIATLTTNVTGHFGYFSEELVNGHYRMAAEYISYILFFLAGAFSSGAMVESAIKRKAEYVHALPIILEIVILTGVIFGSVNEIISIHWISRSLLFAMGLQNALVTQISKATVRTTHLTGLFTDLGIELSQLMFYRQKTETQKLSRSIYLRLSIIGFFFIGGLAGGIAFQEFGMYTLTIAVAVLASTLLHDRLKSNALTPPNAISKEA